MPKVIYFSYKKTDF